MTRDCKKIIASGVMIIFGLLLVDLSIGFIGKLLQDNMPESSSQVSKFNRAIKSLETDVLIVGSSRAGHHYIPDSIDAQINHTKNIVYSTHNAARDGHFIDCSCCIVECALERYTPKVVIMELADYELNDIYGEEKLLSFTPYYGNNRVVKKYLDNLGWQERACLSTNLYRYNDKLIILAKAYLSGADLTRGYKPLYGVMAVNSDRKSVNKIESKDESEMMPKHTRGVMNFTNVIRLCKEKNVTLVVASSPYYGMQQKNVLVKNICDSHNIPYIDFWSTEYFNNHPELFQDESHLNDAGAKKYSGMFWDELQRYI